MKKNLFIILVTFFTFGLIFPTISFASTEPNDNIDTKTKEQLLKEFKDEGLINKNIRAKDIESIKEVNDPHNYKITPFLSGNEPTYTYWLQSGKAKYTKTSYGKWTNKGGAFHGPGNFSKTFTTSTSLSVSGGISKSGLKASLGKKYKVTTKASRKIPKNKKGQFQVRNVYKHYKVTMKEWISIDGRKSTTGKKKTGTVKKKTGVESRIKLK